MSLSFKESLNQISSGDFIGNGGNWQNHPSYTHSDIYTDRSISTISSKKNIRLNSRQFNITQEENSQYIPFEMPRFYDGLDLVNATISIHYETSGERHGASQPINVIYNDNKIRFGWLIDSNVTSDPGKLKFEIHAYGVVHEANGETTAYVWKSKSNEKLNVLQSICSTDEVITAVDDSWVQELVTDITERVAESLRDVALNEQVQAAVHDAKQYADDLNATTSNKIESIDKEIDVIFDEIENFSADSVQYVAQKLTDTQMAQARKNINANGFDWHAIGEYNGYAANMGNYNSITDWDRLLAVPSSTNSSAPAFGELLTAVSILLTGYDKSVSKEKALKDFNAAILDLSSAGILPSDYRIVHTLDVENANKYLFVIMQYNASNNRWILTDQTGDVARFIAVTGDEIIDDTTLIYPDTTLSIDGRAADAKAVGQALDLKAELEHNHKISNIDGLQVALDNKASLLHDHDGNYDAKGAAGTAEANAKAYTDKLANGQVKTNKEAIAKLNGAATEEGSVAKAVADAKALIDADIDAVETITGKNKEDIAAINNAKSGILAQAKAYADAEYAKIEKSVGDLATLVGTLPEGTTAKDVVEYVNVKTSGIATDTAPGELQGQLSSVQSEVATIKGDYLKAADKTELQGNIDTLTGVVETLRDGIDADKVDGVKDLIAYVEEHGPEVTGMKEDIAENAEAIEGVAGRMTTAEGKITAVEGVVATKVEQSVYDEKVAALEGTDAGLSGRITAIENKFGGAEGSVEDMIADAKQEAIDAAAGDATTKANAAKDAAIAKANELNTAMNTRVEVLEAIGHDHNILYYTKTQIDTKLSAKSDSAHNHDSVYDTKGSASKALAEANAYTKETCNALAENFDSAIAMMYGADITEDLTAAPTIRDIATNVYMENRTHGIELDSTEQLLPDTVVNIDEYGSGGYITTPIAVITGETYLVKWDGKKYLCTVKETLMEGSGQVQILGNAKAAGASDIEPSNEPFVILIFPAETAIEMGVYGAIMAVDGTTNTEITVSIEGGLVETYMPLDIRYLPDNVVTSEELGGYETKGSASAALDNAKLYTDEKVANLLNNSTEAVDSIMELADAMKDNADAIEALNEIAASKVPTSRTINGKALTADITLSASDVGASETSHIHDDRYYTETEIDNKLSGKSDTSHNHDSVYALKSLYDTNAINIGRKANTTVGNYSMALGYNTIASGNYSQAGGCTTKATGEYSYAEGYLSEALGYASHAEGQGAKAVGRNQHVQGRYNKVDNEDRYAHIVGNGSYHEDTQGWLSSNAHTLDWEGNAWFAGEVYVGGDSQDANNTEKLVKASELEAYVTETELTAKGYLTSVPSEYVTETELSAKGYQTAAQVQTATNNALEQAKANGEFDGEDGFSVYKSIISPVESLDYDAEFDAPSQIQTNGKTIKIGDFIFSPDGKTYIVEYIKGNTVYGNLHANLTGANGQRGTGVLKITTATTSASGTGDNGVAIKYKIALSTVKSEAGVDEVFVGDTILRSYYTYQVVKVDADYVYLSAYTSIRGATGGTGANGTSVTVSNVTESTADGGSNVVTFSDGKTITIKNGSKGSTGDKGADGKTPVKGTDYFTNKEVAEIVEKAKPQKGIDYFDGEDGKDGKDGKDGTVQIEPLFAESVEWLEENGDITKLYILPNNLIYAYMYTEGEAPSYTNWLPIADTTTRMSGDEAATVMTGYFSGNRLNSSGLLKKYTGYSVTGFIPYTYKGTSDFICIQGSTCTPNKTYTQALAFYDASHNHLGQAGFATANYDDIINNPSDAIGLTITKNSDNTYTLTWKPAETTNIKNGTIDTSKIAYFRFCTGDFANAIITINEKAEGGGGSAAGYQWASTGHSFIPTDYEDRIIALEKKASGASSVQSYINDRNTYIAPVPSGYCESKMTFTDFSTKVTDTIKGETNLLAMIQRFRDLATANPGYITETLLGKDASNTYNIYKYELELSPAVRNSTSKMKKDKPVFIITAGLHGIEPDAVWEVYHFMQDICDNYIESEQLNYLRNNVKFVIVPISNPWGFVNSTYNNSNDVNLNKNFEHGFSYVANTAGSQLNTGANAYSEAEAALLKEVFDEYSNAVFHLECHGKAGVDANCSDTIWFSLMQSLASELIEISANTVVHQIGCKLYELGYNADKTEGGYLTYYPLGGRPKDYTGTEYGMLSCTMEGSGRMGFASHTTFTKDEQRVNCEALENFILRVLDALNSRVEI